MTPSPLLLELPWDILQQHVLQQLLDSDPTAALRLAMVCRDVRLCLLPLVDHFISHHRVHWAKMHGCELDGAAIAVTTRDGSRVAGRDSWAACDLLPTTGRSTWEVKINHTFSNRGMVMIGVCEETSHQAWALYAFTGTLRRCRLQCDAVRCGGAPWEGWPDFDHTPLLVDDASGLYSDLDGSANGAVVECTWDADDGCLSFRVNGGATLVAIDCFKRGTALRPWVRLNFAEDRITIGPWLRRGAKGGSRSREEPAVDVS